MNNFRSNLKNAGYGSEEVYCHKEERKLIEKMRASKGKTKNSNVISLPTSKVNPNQMEGKKAA